MPSALKCTIRRSAFALAGLLTFGAPAAHAQNAIPNPLRGQPVEKVQDKTQDRAPETAREKPQEGASASGEETKPARRSRAKDKVEPEANGDTKPKRARSAKQKENDDIMRACGASWRADKEAQQTKGQTWRTYLKDCRAKKKGEQKA